MLDALRLTDQAAYEEADYLRDYQKHHQHGELLAAEVLDYGALHLAWRRRAALRYRDSAATSEGDLRLRRRDAHTPSEMTSVDTDDNRLPPRSEPGIGPSKWKPAMGNSRRARGGIREISNFETYRALAPARRRRRRDVSIPRREERTPALPLRLT